ncbi:MAG: dipeptide epimerase [Gemmatimonadota bacterium]|nr:dipeptide epimerase [Gemmatimonadota bacterium]
MKVSWETLSIETTHPFGISRNVRTGEEVVWLHLELDGVEGWGEADPSAYYGETAATATAALERLSTRIGEIEDPFALEAIERDIGAMIGKNGAARAAVSAALHDWIGKKVGLPLWRLWGLDPAGAPLSSFTIGIDTPERMAEKTREAADFPILKIKLGSDDDRARLEAVRGAAPDRVLRVDANAAWTPREAVAGCAMCAEFGVEFVEQPLPPDRNADLAFVRERSPLPIIVDESSIVASDIPGLAGLCDGINIKLAKCGGPREAIRMVHVARAHGLSVMLGCMLETTLGIAPAAHMSPLVDFADLDGAALLANDPFVGPRLDAGRIVLGDEPGLGVAPAG